MVKTTAADNVIVEEVVVALTGGEGQRSDLRAQMERAAREFDAHTANSFCKALLTHLTEDPAAVRELEALIILGLAHPRVLEDNRIPLVQEARRLAVLLEKKGQAERAQTLLEMLAAHAPGDRGVERELGGIMRRTGSLDRLVERHLRRAEDAIRTGNREEAVRWLREVLLLDSSRRDVARMIRDLRYEAGITRTRWTRVLKFTTVVALLGGAIYGVIWREGRMRSEFEALPAAAANDVPAMQQRLATLDSWMGDNLLWLGTLEASRERARLRTELDKIKAASRDLERGQRMTRERAVAAAESERVNGRIAAEKNEFLRAREHFTRALKVAPPDWPERLQVQTDIDAIGAWQQRLEVSQRENSDR